MTRPAVKKSTVPPICGKTAAQELPGVLDLMVADPRTSSAAKPKLPINLPLGLAVVM